MTGELKSLVIHPVSYTHLAGSAGAAVVSACPPAVAAVVELAGLPDPHPASKDAVIAAASPKEKIFFNFMQYFLLFRNKKA